MKKKRCSVLTNNNNKINWDSDHHTLDGARYFGKLIHNSGWLDVD